MDWVTARSSIGEFFHGRRIEIREVFQLESTKAGTIGGDFDSSPHPRDSGTPPVCHRSQIHRSFLPRRQKFQEVTEMIDTTFFGNGICHSCRQVREDDFQGIAGMGNVKWVERKDDEMTTYDLSAAQSVSSSMCPPRNMTHMRRMLAIVGR